jgi:hypothetical protein
MDRKVTAATVLLFGLLIGAAVSRAERNSTLPPRERPLEAVNVEIPYAVVTGTVSVRAGGVPVSPADVTYAFQPDFKFSTGYLTLIKDGVYRFRADHVPADQPHTLTIKAAWNDTLVKDGVVLRQGRTYAGTLRLDIPFGRDYNFGDQILDLN